MLTVEKNLLYQTIYIIYFFLKKYRLVILLLKKYVHRMLLNGRFYTV